MAILVSSIAEAMGRPTGHYLVETPVTTLASGQRLTFTTHVLRGARPGPAVGIMSGLHGDEISTAEVVLSLLPLVPVSELSGTLLLVPMANPPTFEWATRSSLIDAGNLNRAFPGRPDGTVTEMLAHAISQHFLPACQVLFDLHSEPDACGIRGCRADSPVDDYGRRAFELAQASGCPILCTDTGIPGTLSYEARRRGILAVVAETGGPLPGPAGLLHESQQELLNMLRSLKSIPGEVAPHGPQVVVVRLAHVRASVGGLFRPVAGFEVVGRSVPAGQLLGTIASPYTGETMAEFRAPFGASWMFMARGRLSKVHPGDPLYIIGAEA